MGLKKGFILYMCACCVCVCLCTWGHTARGRGAPRGVGGSGWGKGGARCGAGGCLLRWLRGRVVASASARARAWAVMAFPGDGAPHGTAPFYAWALAFLRDFLAAHGWSIVFGTVALALALPPLCARLGAVRERLEESADPGRRDRLNNGAAAARARQQAALEKAAAERREQERAQAEERRRAAQAARNARTTGGDGESSEALKSLASTKPKQKPKPSYTLGGSAGASGSGVYRPGGPSARYRSRGG